MVKIQEQLFKLTDSPSAVCSFLFSVSVVAESFHRLGRLRTVNPSPSDAQEHLKEQSDILGSTLLPES